MKLSPLLISIVIFSGVIVAMAGIYADFTVKYAVKNSTAESSLLVFNESYTTLSTDMESLQNHTIGFWKKGLTDPSKYYDLALAFLDLGGIILGIPNVVTTVFMPQISNVLPLVPKWVIDIVGLVVAIMITMKLASIVVKTEEL